MKSKIMLLALLLGMIFIFYHFNLNHFLSLEYIKTHQDAIRVLYENSPLKIILMYFIIYVTLTAMMVPGATILTLIAGALFGLVKGTIIVSFASTLGATLAFIGSRLLFKEWVERKFADKLQIINNGIDKEGVFYLFTLRLVPLFPFFLINLLMGITNIKIRSFYLVSQVGMLAATIVYINAGVALSEISSLEEILSLRLIFSFSLLGIFPLFSKKLLEFVKSKRVYKPYKKPKKFDYDMLVIGGGAAGLVTAYISSVVKAQVALVEKNKMGGDCLNTGCVPSKALIKAAKIVYEAKNAQKYGLKNTNIDFNFSDIMRRVHKVIEQIEPHDSIERYNTLGVDCMKGVAQIISPWEIKIDDKIITTKNITIATGAHPFVPDFKGLENINYLTSDNLWNITQLPNNFLILGAGPIGVEMAQCFARLGSKVTLIEMAERLITCEDPETSHFLSKKLTEDGVKILTAHKGTEFIIKDNKQYLICETSNGTVSINFDQILIALGRKARTTGYGLENLNISYNQNGTIHVNEYLRTKYPNIYACGDVAGPFQLTNTAAHQAWYCAINGLFGKYKKFKINYKVIPRCTYTDPEIASVGINETKAKEQDMPYKLSIYPLNNLDRAIIDGTNDGMIRILTSPSSDKILGATIIGAHASDIILEIVTAMKYNLGLNKILGTIHIYPSMGEANKYAASIWKQASINPKYIKWLSKLL